jgi:hypothetical protein
MHYIQCRRKYATISVFHVDILTLSLWKLRWEQNTFTLKMEIARSSQTSVILWRVSTYQRTATFIVTVVRGSNL